MLILVSWAGCLPAAGCQPALWLPVDRRRRPTPGISVLNPRPRANRGCGQGSPRDQELEPDFITAADLVAAPHRSPGGKARGVDVEQNEGARRQCLRRGNSGARAVSVDTPNTEPLPI